MTPSDLIARHDRPVPRYTSYPTAPHFSDKITPDIYAGWLENLPDGPVSLYLHVPFCDRLCLYCGCNTTVVRQHAPRRAYAELLAREIALVAAKTGRRTVSAVHWGGGTPTTLPNDALTGLMDLIRHQFHVPPASEIAIEIDPTSFTTSTRDALAQMGVTRASLGVQDFDPKVQEAIGRIQTFEQTETCANALRAIGIGSLNLDLIYGLPHQSTASVARTAHQALALNPARVAVFGYAHVPWMKKHQSLIPQAALPGPAARFEQSRTIADVLERAGGFIPVGLDHYALPHDELIQSAAQNTLHRNFQGYTTDTAPSLIGLGASAIGNLPQGYAQNAPTVPTYAAAIRADQFATTRGIALTPEDCLRRAVIERLMCDCHVNLRDQAAQHHADPAPLLEAAQALAPLVADGLVVVDSGSVTVTEAGRPFLRNAASAFDAYAPSRAAMAV